MCKRCARGASVSEALLWLCEVHTEHGWGRARWDVCKVGGVQGGRPGGAGECARGVRGVRACQEGCHGCARCTRSVGDVQGRRLGGG